MKTSTTAAYDLVCDMELPLLAVQNFARLIAGFAGGLDDSRDATALQAAAYHIHDLAEALKERREKAFHLLNPNPNHVVPPTVALVRPSGDK
jgi:hypothetical protein